MWHTWPGNLHAARTEEEVVEVARDFLATFGPTELASIPARLRPPRLRDGKDVTDYAYTLVRFRVDDERSSSALIDRLSAFFSDATVRISQLAVVAEPAEREKES